MRAIESGTADLSMQLRDRSLSRAFERLNRLMPNKVATDKALARFTTLRVGGPAAIYLVVDTLSELRILTETISDYDLPAMILGRGSNVLISDKGVSGIVFQLGRDFSQVVVDGTEIRAGAAATLTSLVQTAARSQLAGLTFAVGIPGTVGAAVALNAGAHGGDMGQIVKRMTYYSRDCRLNTAGADRLTFSYRRCQLPAGAVILEAQLGLTPASAAVIKSQMETNWRRRKTSQPLDLPNAGSMFKNPEGDFAGRLIEEAGCKGRQIGGAQVSNKHANFFVNTGNATAADFCRLMVEVVDAVKDFAGVELEPEIRMIGDWSYAAPR